LLLLLLFVVFVVSAVLINCFADAWAATFEQIFTLSSPRTDIPMQAPAPPAPTLTRHTMAHIPLNDLHTHTLNTLAALVPQAKGDLEAVVKQHEFGAAAQRALEQHRQNMKNHHVLRNSWRVAVQPPAALSNKESKFLWTNGSIIAEKITVNTTASCLDVDDLVEGAHIVLSACADWDAGQQWSWNNDGSISLTHAPHLCLGTPIAQNTTYGSQPAIVSRCGDYVNVHWAVVREGEGSTATRATGVRKTHWIFYFSNAAVLCIVAA
jgi:hypothetical protein